MKNPLSVAALAGAFAGALIALPALASGAQDTDKIRPGYWEYDYKILGITVSTEYKCVKPSEIDKVFFAGPCNRHHRCEYPVRDVGDGKARFEGTWTDKRGRVARVKAHGTYTDTTFNLNASGTMTNGIPMAATMEAKWLRATCPAGAS